MTFSQRAFARAHSAYLTDLAERSVRVLAPRPRALTARQLLGELRVENLDAMSLSFFLRRHPMIRTIPRGHGHSARYVHVAWESVVRASRSRAHTASNPEAGRA